MSTLSLRFALSAASLAALVLAACGGDSPEISPAPIGSGGSSADASPDVTSPEGGAGSGGGSAGAGGAEPDAGQVPVRTVIVRDVFDRIDVADNLMADGGFEFSGAMSSVWGSGSYGDMEFASGAACRSGLRCAIADSSGIYGFFASPLTGQIDISIHVAAKVGVCPDIDAYAFDAYSQNNPKVLAITSATVEPDGWCVMKASSSAIPYKVPLLYLVAASGTAVIDDVVVREVPATPAPAAKSWATPSPVMQQRLREVAHLARGQLLRERKRTASPPNAAPWNARFHPWLR